MKNLNLKISIFLLFSLFSTLSANLFAASRTPQHYLIFLHGIGDGIERFKTTGLVLPKFLNKKKIKNTYGDNYEFLSLYYKYRTGVDVLDTTHFARGFGKFLKRKFKNTTLEEGDRISILAHSQGGIVAINWLYHVYHDLGDYKGGEYFKYLYSMVTFGAPYLGTEIVKIPLKIGTEIFQLFRFPVGRNELEDMLYASPMMDSIVDMAMDNKHGFRNYLKYDLRFYNLVGNAGAYPTFSSSNFGLQDDTAVPVTSAHLNFLYYKNGIYTDYDGIAYEVVKAAHIDLPFIDGLVEFPKNCLNDIVCDHKTFNLTQKILAGENLEGIATKDFLNKTKTHSSVVHIKLKLSHEFPIDIDDIDPSDLKIKVSGNNKISLRHSPFYFHVKKLDFDPKYKYRVDAFFSVKIKSENSDERANALLFFYNAHKNIELWVRKAHTTIIDSDFVL